MSELCVWDLDGTLRPGSLLAEAIIHGAEAGFIDLSQYNDPLHPRYSEVPYFMQAVTQRPRRDFQELIDRVAEEALDVTYPFALERLVYQAEHAHPVIISHSPDFLVKAFARGLGFVRHARGSYFHTQNLVFSGKNVGLQKTKAARRYQREKALPTLAFAAGDTFNDVPLLKKAASSLVVNPDEDLTLLAEQRGWEIIRV